MSFRDIGMERKDSNSFLSVRFDLPDGGMGDGGETKGEGHTSRLVKHTMRRR